MSSGWQVRDEFIDLAQARHVIIFHNPDTNSEHHLINYFNLKACPTCGTPKTQTEATDIVKLKTDTLAALKTHHAKVMDYRNKFPHVRIGNAQK